MGKKLSFKNSIKKLDPLIPITELPTTQKKCLLIVSIHLLIVPVNSLMISVTLGNVQKYEN
jgi:hypothetical protein